MSTNDIKQALIEQVRALPEQPGVYQFFNKSQQVIYVGKAKNLRKRVYSYFAKEHEYGKTRYLVHNITELRVIVVATELDALLLENNLIKKYQPRYNVALKDDKTFPWICIKKEPFPRIFVTRRMVRDGSQYFGPYANVKMMYTLLDLIKQLYPLRNCNLQLNPTNIAAKKFKVCLEYHLGNCLGPCEAKQDLASYDQEIAQIKDILKGNSATVLEFLKAMKDRFAEELQFEHAQAVKEKIELLENYRSKAVVVSPSIHNVDVFTVVSTSEAGFVNYFKVVNGAIVQTHTLELRKKLDESDLELLSIAITELRQRFESSSKEVLVPMMPDIELPDVQFVIPKIGDKKKLMELSERNARYFMRDRLAQYEKLYPKNKDEQTLEQMKNDLHMQEQPTHIECFDNSNFQGDYAVAAMTVFKNLKPSKKDYRHFNIRTVVGPDDFASMEEIVYRRYKRLLEENQPLPQLIVIDGGKGQLSSALGSLEMLGLRGKIAIIGIAKKLEEIYYPGDSVPMYLDKRSPTLKIIQQLRDEAHRFGITHHRNQRSKGLIRTALTDVPGIGEATATKLLTHFKSLKGLLASTPEELDVFAGKAIAKKIRAHFSEAEPEEDSAL